MIYRAPAMPRLSLKGRVKHSPSVTNFKDQQEETEEEEKNSKSAYSGEGL